MPIDQRFWARPSAIYNLSPVGKGNFTPNGTVSSGFSVMASWMLGIDDAMARGTSFEKEVMNPILDWVEGQTGVKIHRNTDFQMQFGNSNLQGHPDWIIERPDGRCIVIDAKRGSQHDNAAYLFQPGLYGLAVSRGAIKNIKSTNVEAVGISFFNSQAEDQIIALVKSAGRGDVDEHQAAVSILDAITGGKYAGNSSPTGLSAVKTITSEIPSEASLHAGVRTLERLNFETYELTGMTPEELFKTQAPADPGEREIQIKQRAEINEIVTMRAYKLIDKDDAQSMVREVMAKYGNRPLGGLSPSSPSSMSIPQKKEYVSLDIETGGLIEHYGQASSVPILAIAADVHDESGAVIEHREWMVNDLTNIWKNPDAMQKALAKNHIDLDECRKSMDTMDSILPVLQRMVNGRTVVGHNIKNFDMRILGARGVQFGRYEDTMEIASRQGYTKTGFIGFQKLYQTITGNKGYIEAHSANQDQQDEWNAFVFMRDNPQIGNPGKPDFSHINEIPDWKDAPTDLVQKLGSNARAKIAPSGNRIALYNSQGNVFYVGRLAQTQAGWTINGRVMSKTQVNNQMTEQPLQYRNLFDEVMTAYGDGGQGGVKRAMKAFYKGTENMSLANGKAFLSSARAAQLQSAAVMDFGAGTVADWFMDMREFAEMSGDESLKHYVFRTVDSKFMFDVMKTIDAGPLTLIKDGKAYYGSGKPGDAVKRVQQMAREFAMSTDPARRIASVFLSQGSNMPEFGNQYNVAQLGHVPEGAIYFGSTEHFYQDTAKNVELGDSRIDLWDRKQWKVEVGPNGNRVAVGKDTSDGKTIWLDADSKQDIIEISRQRGKGNGRELQYTVRQTGASTGSQIKVWLPVKATVSEMDFEKLGISPNMGIDAIAQLGKSSRFMAQAVLSGEFQGEKFNDLVKMIQANLGRNLTESELVTVNPGSEIDREARRRGVNLQGRTQFIKHTAEIDNAIGQVYENWVDQRSRENAWFNVKWPANRLEYEAYKRAAGSGFRITEVSEADLRDWDQHPERPKLIPMSFATPLVAKMMLNVGLLTSGEASMPLELIEQAFRKYPQSVVNRLLGMSARNRSPYQDLLRTRLVTSGEADESRLTESGRSIVSLDDLREKMLNAPGGSFMTRLKHALGNDYLKVTSQGNSFYVGGEVVQWMATPNAVNRLKKNYWHAGDDEDDADSDKEVGQAGEAVNASVRALKRLIEGNGSGYEDDHAARLFETLYDKKTGLSRMPAIIRGGLGAQFPHRMSGQGTYTAVAGLAPNEILVGNDKLRKMFPGVSMGEINRALEGKQGIVSLMQRYPNVAEAVTSLGAFKLVSEGIVGRREGMAVRLGFTGYGLNQFAMETIFGDFDGDQLMMVLASTFNINKEEGTIDNIDNEQAVRIAASVRNSIRHTAKAIGVITGDDHFIQDDISITELFDKIQEMGEAGTNVSELGKWIKTLKDMNTAPGKGETAAGALKRSNWDVGRSVRDLIGDYKSTIIGKRQMGPSYNTGIRNLTSATRALVGDMPAEIDSASSWGAWLNRTEVLVHQKSVDMNLFSDSMRMYMTMKDRFNPFADRRQGIGRAKEELSGQEFEGDFNSALWKMVDSIVGSYQEFQGLGQFKDGKTLNSRWSEDMAKGITLDEGMQGAIRGAVDEAFANGVPDNKGIEALGKRIRMDVFGNDPTKLLENIGPWAAVPVANWLDKGSQHGGLAYANTMGASVPENQTDYMRKLKDIGTAMRQGKELATGEMGEEEQLSQLMAANSQVKASTVQRIFSMIMNRLPKQSFQGATGDAKADIAALISRKDMTWTSFADALINGGYAANHEQMMEILKNALVDNPDDERVESAIGFMGNYGKDNWDLIKAPGFFAGKGGDVIRRMRAARATGNRPQGSGGSRPRPAAQDLSTAMGNLLAGRGAKSYTVKTSEGGGFSFFPREDYIPSANDEGFKKDLLDNRSWSRDELSDLQSSVNPGLLKIANKMQQGKIGINDMLAMGGKFGFSNEEINKVAGQSDLNAQASKLSKSFESLGDVVGRATKNATNFDEVLKRMSDHEKPLSKDEQERQKAVLPQMQALLNSRGTAGSEQAEQLRQQMIVAGVAAGQTLPEAQSGAASVMGSLGQYEQMTEAERASIEAGKGSTFAPKTLGGKMKSGIFSGNLGNLAWGMIDINRVWNYTGGVVAGDMQKYAGYQAEQQQSLAGMGDTSGYTGTPLQMIRSENAMKRAQLSLGKAGWDMFGWIPGAAAGLLGGSDPNHPAFGAYAGAAGLGLGGVGMAAGIAGNIATSLGAPALSGGLGAVSSAATGAIAPVLGVLGGAEISRKLNEGTDPYASDFGTYVSSRWVKARELWAGTADAASKATPEERALANKYNVQFLKEAGLGEKTADEKQQQKMFDLGTALEGRVEQIAPGSGGKIYAQIAQTYGLSQDQLAYSPSQKLAEALGRSSVDPQVQQYRAQIGQQMGTLAGYRYGSMASVNSGIEAAGINNIGTLMNAQLVAQQLGPTQSFLQGMGLQVSQLASPDYVSQMTPGQIYQSNAIAQGNQRATSSDFIQMLYGQRSRQYGSKTSYQSVPIRHADGSISWQNQMIQTPLNLSNEQIRQGVSMEPNTFQAPGTTNIGLLSNQARRMGYQLSGVSQSMDLSQLRSVTENQRMMNQEDIGYQGYQFGQQQQSFQRNWSYTFGNKAQGIQGEFALQLAGIGEDLRHARKQLQMEAGTLGGGYGFVGTQGQGLAGMSLAQLGSAGTAYRQFYENLAVSREGQLQGRGWQQEDILRDYNRGMTQLGWSRTDLGIQYGREQTQFGWQATDLGIQMGRTKQQFNWGEQDIAYQGTQQALSYGWGQEDIATQMRYATGRERRQLAKQSQRNTISYGLQEGQLSREDERLKEREKWAEADYQKEMARLKEREKWSTQDFNREKGRLDTHEKWLNEDLNRELGRINTRAKLEDQQYELEKTHEEENVKLAQVSWEENKKHTEAMAGIQAQQIKERMDATKAQMVQEEQMNIMAEAHWIKQTAIQAQLAVITAAQQFQVTQIAQTWNDPNGPIVLAVKSLVNSMAQSFSANPYDPKAVVYKSFNDLMNAMVHNMQQHINQAAGGG